MKILVTGQYDQTYNRTLIILQGLKELGHEIVEFRYAKQDTETALKITELSQQCAFVFMPSFTHKDIMFVKSHAKCPMIFDPLISKWMTGVLDYKQFSRFGLKAWRDFRLDKKTFETADGLITDTNTHADWLSHKFKIPRKKFTTAYVGVNCEEFHPIQTQNKKLKIGFYGGFIPLQGSLNIVEAIRLIKDQDFDFELIGTGFEYEKAKKLIKKYDLKISLPGWVDYQKLNFMINSYDICLGIFGETVKADLVIPNKVFHYAACGKAIISKKTPAMLEVFEDQKNILYSSSNPEDIAEKILLLNTNQHLRVKLGKNVRRLMEDKFNCKNIAESVLKSFHQL